MTKTEKLREEIAEAIYHFVHRGSVNYISWQKLPHKYGRAQYILIATQILKACQEADLVFLVKDAELPLEMYETTATTKLAKLIRDYCNQAGFRQTEEICLE